MPKLHITKGTENHSEEVFIQDSSSAVGDGLAGLVFNSSGLKAYWSSPKTAPIVIPLMVQTITGIWVAGGFVEKDAVNMKGCYRFDLPNTSLNPSGISSTIMLSGASNMAPVPLEIQLTGFDFTDPKAALAAVAAVGDPSIDLVTAYNQIAARIVDITANPQPSYKSGDKEYSWGEYLNILTTVLKRMKDNIQREELPYLIRTQLRA